MQPECVHSAAVFRKRRVRRAGSIVLAAGLLAGCGQTVTTIDPPPPTPHAGASLDVNFSSSLRYPELLGGFAREWSGRTGAAVEVKSPPAGLSPLGDIAVIGPAELPALAEAGHIVPVPAAVFGSDHPYQWNGLLPMQAGTMSRWGTTVFGVPLLGSGRVMVYRFDRLEKAKFKPPDKDNEWTWEDYLAAAKEMAKTGAPSLPPLPARAVDLDAEFHVIAACYDRPAVTQAEAGPGIIDDAAADRFLSYHYRLATSKPRINAPAFVHALGLLRAMRPLRVPGEADRPSDAFRAGTAALCIATLDDLARFQQPDSPVRGKFKIAPLPGAQFTFDLDEGRTLVNVGVNRMPYLGAGDWVGVVGKDCANPAAAFEFLTAFGHPEKMGAEAITAAKWGAGPFRSLHTEERALGLWLGYDLPGKETDVLLDALKRNTATSLVTHRYRLRLPNQLAHLEVFDKSLRAALTMEVADPRRTLDALNGQWEALWRDVPNAKRHAWVRLSHGLGSSE